MAQPPFNRAIASAVAELVDAQSPLSHDQLDRLFAASPLRGADPAARGQSTIGKVKRARAVLSAAVTTDPVAGSKLAAELLAMLGTSGWLDPDEESSAGTERIRHLQTAYGAEGWQVSEDGALVPRVVDGLAGAELDAALGQILRRARQGALDAALVTGSGKDLLEAVARQVLVKHTGAYPQHGNFPATLYQAFDRLSLPTPPQQEMATFRSALESDARGRFVQVLFLLGCTINELRNQQGVGHGRPFPPSVTDAEAKAAIQGMALIAEFLRELA